MNSTSLFAQVHFHFKGRLVLLLLLLLSFIIDNFVLTINSVDPDQTPQNVASDLGLRCLPMSMSFF